MTALESPSSGPRYLTRTTWCWPAVSPAGWAVRTRPCRPWSPATSTWSIPVICGSTCETGPRWWWAGDEHGDRHPRDGRPVAGRGAARPGPHRGGGRGAARRRASGAEAAPPPPPSGRLVRHQHLPRDGGPVRPWRPSLPRLRDAPAARDGAADEPVRPALDGGRHPSCRDGSHMLLATARRRQRG